jgi:hypothetical protein
MALHTHNPPVCSVCGELLTDDNWNISQKKHPLYRCKSCHNSICKDWRKRHANRYRATYTQANRKNGHLPMRQNRSCPLFMGVHIAERLLSRVFKDVERMPNGNKGFDFICTNGFQIDVKSSCTHSRKNGASYWHFGINKNMIADYFLCIAFDNRDDLNPLYLWMIPSHIINYKTCVDISSSTIEKWDDYAIDIEKTIECCDDIKTATK